MPTAATREGNRENQIALLGDRPDPASAEDLSLTLLRHHASSVKHHQYHNADVFPSTNSAELVESTW